MEKTLLTSSLLKVLMVCVFLPLSEGFIKCGGGPSKKKLKYLSGDALSDPRNCIGPDGKHYPFEEIQKYAPEANRRTGKSLFSDKSGSQDPYVTRQELLHVYGLSRDGELSEGSDRHKRNAGDSGECVVGGAPPRLCRSSYNTTAPMYGVSLTSGQPVTIVQKFPDLLQQVIYETCDSSQCDVIHGECIQTYVPYLFLVIPLGPVTLTGQDYVLVESGCTCRPKYATPGTDPNPQDIIPNFN